MDELLKEVRNINAIISEIYSKIKNSSAVVKDESKISEYDIINYDDKLLDLLGSFKFFKVNGKYLLKPLTETNPEYSISGYSLQANLPIMFCCGVIGVQVSLL